MESRLIYHMGYVKAHLAVNKKRIFLSTHVKVSKDLLDSKCFVKVRSHSNWQSLNQQILIYKQKLDDAILKDLQQNKSIDIDRIKHWLREGNVTEQTHEKPEIQKSEMLFTEVLLEFISDQVNTRAPLRSRYESLLKIIYHRNSRCGSITPPYLYEILEHFRKGVNANTAHTRYKNFKTFIAWCSNNEYPLPKIEWKRFYKPTFKPDFVFLTDERIAHLINLRNLSVSEARVRDIFLVLIYTGMRYSDYSSLKNHEIQDKHIDKIARKTSTRFKVPIHSLIQDILIRPPKMSNQIFNKQLQMLGRKAGWNELVRYRKDLNEFIMVPFCDLLCSSVGRHTFATRALLEGIPHNVIMGWCGWSNSSMLFYYSEKIKVQTTNWMNKLK